MLDLAKLMDCNLFWLGLIVLVSYTTQAITGFGSTIIDLTLGVHLVPIEVLLPVLVPLYMLVNFYIATRYHRNVNHPLLFRSIIPAMGIGLLAGIITFHLLQGIILKKIFGLLVFVLSIRELYRLFKNISDQKVLSRIKSNCYILIAGVIHGIYASGGPLLI
jgi:uncharacterized membrane protein YfcA